MYLVCEVSVYELPVGLFDSITSVARFLECSYTNVFNSLKYLRKCCGYMVEYVDI